MSLASVDTTRREVPVSTDLEQHGESDDGSRPGVVAVLRAVRAPLVDPTSVDRISRMRRVIIRRDVFDWSTTFLAALDAVPRRDDADESANDQSPATRSATESTILDGRKG